MVMSEPAMKTAERYWHGGDAPDALLDWVSENVVEAIRECWETDAPAGWIEEKEGRLLLKIGGPGKPTAEDPTGMTDIYTVKFDLLSELTDYSEPYADVGSLSDVQKEDMRERSTALRKLADDIAGLASRAAESA